MIKYRYFNYKNIYDILFCGNKEIVKNKENKVGIK